MRTTNWPENGFSGGSPRPAKARSALAEAIHETAAGLHRIGLLDKATMREFDASCLTKIEPLSPRQIAALRRREGVSQGVFAHYLNVRPKLVGEWSAAKRSRAAHL